MASRIAPVIHLPVLAWLVGLVFLLSACAATPGSPPATALPASPGLATAIDNLLNDLAGNDQFSGSVLVAIDDRVILSQGYGLADRERAIANTPQTRFRIGSLTKQFTAMAILILQSQGKLDVQDRACEYLAACPAAWQEITIHQLLTHTAGIPNYTALPGYLETRSTPVTPEQLLLRFKDLPLDFQPGAEFRYSNSGYIVLGMIIESVSGQSYEEFLQAAIFSPLGMADSGYDHNRSDLATGYANRSTLADAIDMSIPFSAGGLYSTTEDLARWSQALESEKLVSKDLLTQMFTAHARTPETTERGYGYGWYINDGGSRRWANHGGAIEGFVSGITRFPDDNVEIIILSNQQTTNLESITSAIVRLIFPG